MAKALLSERAAAVHQKLVLIPAASAAAATSRLVQSGTSTPASNMNATAVRRRSMRRIPGTNAASASAASTAVEQLPRYPITARAGETVASVSTTRK